MQFRDVIEQGPFALTGLLLSACAALLSLAGCAPAAGVAPLGPGAATRVHEELLVSHEWLARQVEDPSVVVLHVGADPVAYERGHVPGARFLQLSTILTEREGNANELPPVARLDSVFESVGVSDGSRVVVYGAPLAAARAFFTLDYLGHGDRTALLNGGLEAWRASGRPLSSETPTISQGAFTPSPEPGRVVDADWIHRRLGDSAVALVDARPEAQFAGTVPGTGIPRGGHIPGAGNVFWEELLHATQQPVLQDVDSLLGTFRAAGVEPGDTVVTYCRSGMQASFAYFVARYLGYDTRMYDGSFLDWSRRAGLPVER